MKQSTSDSVVIAHLRKGPVLIWAAVGFSITAFSFWEMVWGENFSGSIFYALFGDYLGPLVVISGLFASCSFARMWRGRASYLRYDDKQLYRGSEKSWPLESIRDVAITRNFAGISSIRIVLSDSEQPELAKSYMLVENADNVRDTVTSVLENQRTRTR